MPVTPDKPGPYSPAATVIDVMNRSRDRGLPLPVNAENLVRIGVPDSLVTRVLSTLVALDLIDDSGAPTPTLENLQRAPEAEYKKRQEDWLKSAYADIFAIVDPTKDDETRVRDAFRSYNPVGQQSRMVSLFMGLCAAAGMIPEKPVPTTRPAARQARPAQPAPTRPSAAVVNVRRVMHKPARVSASFDTLPPAISGLLESLPEPSDGWTKADRDRFYTTFGTVLDFCIPIRKASDIKENDSHE